LEHVWLKIIWLKSSHKSAGEKACRKPFEQNLSDGMTSGKRGPAAEYCSKMAAAMFEFWAYLETNFIRKTCTLEAETLVSG